MGRGKNGPDNDDIIEMAEYTRGSILKRCENMTRRNRENQIACGAYLAISIVTFAIIVMMSCSCESRQQEQQEKDENGFFSNGRRMHHSGLVPG
jgi:hypothetical protein